MHASITVHTSHIHTQAGLTLCGLCASIDPERDGVKGAVLVSKRAGVRVVMITGDYLKTAIAIAKNINILNRNTFVEGNGACFSDVCCVRACVCCMCGFVCGCKPAHASMCLN